MPNFASKLYILMTPTPTMLCDYVCQFERWHLSIWAVFSVAFPFIYKQLHVGVWEAQPLGCAINKSLQVLVGGFDRDPDWPALHNDVILCIWVWVSLLILCQNLLSGSSMFSLKIHLETINVPKHLFILIPLGHKSILNILEPDLCLLTLW